MGRNVEVKARIRGDEQLRYILARMNGHTPMVIRQRDTFFHVPRGRLKLRETGTSNELIYYNRTDRKEPRISEYCIVSLDDSKAHGMLLTRSLGIRGVVTKKRMVYILGQTRIHMDDVEGLGQFIEIEVVLTPHQSSDDGIRIACHIMDDLDIRSGDLVYSAYIDLIEERLSR